MKARMLVLCMVLIFGLGIVGQALAQQEMDSVTSTLFWQGIGKWDYEGAKTRSRPFTLSVYKDETGYWAEYKPENGTPGWKNIPYIRERIEFGPSPTGKIWFQISVFYVFNLSDLTAVLRAPPIAESSLMRTGGNM